MVNAAMARACLNDRARGERPGAVSPYFQAESAGATFAGGDGGPPRSRTPANVTADDRSGPAVQGAPGAKAAGFEWRRTHAEPIAAAMARYGRRRSEVARWPQHRKTVRVLA